MTRSRVSLAAALALLSLAGSCKSHPRPEEWDAYVQHFLDDYFRANPTFAVFQGKHEYDGQFPDWSVAGVRAEDRAPAPRARPRVGVRRRQAGPAPAASSATTCWRWSIGISSGSRKRAPPFTNPYFYGDSLDPNVYVARPYAPLPVRMKALTTWANGVPAALAQIRGTLQTPMPLPLAAIGKIRFGGVATYLENDVPQAFAAVADPALHGSVRQRAHARRGRVPRHGRLVRRAESQRRRQLCARPRSVIRRCCG